MNWSLQVILLLVFASLVSKQDDTSPVQQAGYCLKELESNINSEAFRTQWRTARKDFISKVGQAMNETSISILFKELLSLEWHITDNSHTAKWIHWKSRYWKVMMSLDLNFTVTVTRFIIALQFLENSMLPKFMDKNWEAHKQRDWLLNCSKLINPVQNSSFYDEFYKNIQALLLTYGQKSLEEYNNEATKVVSLINTNARELDKYVKLAGGFEIASGSFGIISGISSVLGLAYAPVRADISLTLTTSGIAFGLVSSILNHLGSYYQISGDLQAGLAVIQIADSIMAEISAILYMLEKYQVSTDEIMKELEGIEEKEMVEYLSGSVVWHMKVFSELGNCKNAIILQGELGRLNAREIASGAGKRIAFRGAAPGIKVPGIVRKILPLEVPSFIIKEASSFASTAAYFNIFFSCLSVVEGILGISSGHTKMTESSDLSKKFRNLTKDIDDAKKNILSAYGIDPMLAFAKDPGKIVKDDRGRPQEWHRACFHGDKCVMLVLLSHNITASQSEHSCRKNGYYLLPVGSKQGSDVIRELLSMFGRSAWISTSSTFVDFAPGYPRYRGRSCLFFSKDHSFKVVDARCRRTMQSAIVCC